MIFQACDQDFWGKQTLSFPKPCWESFFDFQIVFYVNLNFDDFPENDDFWPKFAKKSKKYQNSICHKNRSKSQKSIPSTDLESSRSPLSIAGLRIDFGPIFTVLVTKTPQIAHFGLGKRYTVLVAKRHQKREISSKFFWNLKEDTQSFLNPVSELLCDVWFDFYPNLKFGNFGSKKRGG